VFQASTPRSRGAAAAVVAALAAAAALAAPAVSAGRVYELDECVEIALSSNITLADSRESVEAAGADLMSSWSSMLPSITGSVGHGETFSVSDGTESLSDSYSGSIGLNQTILDGGSLARISGSYHNRDAARHSHEWTRRDIVFRTKENYYNLLKAERLKEVQEEAVELAREQLRKTQSLYDLGSSSKSDLLKAKVQLGQSELSLIGAQKSLEIARANLCYHLGIDLATDIEVVDPSEEDAEVEILDVDVAEAFSRRPDLKAVEESVVSARRSLLAAKASRWPELGLSIGYSRTEPAFGDIFETERDDYVRSVSLQASVPIFRGLATKAQIDASKSALRRSELSLRDARLAVAYEIETVRLAVLESRQRVDVAEQSVSSAEEDLRISEERYRLRSASMLELIDARVAYSRARTDLIEARYDYEIAKAELKLALGL